MTGRWQSIRGRSVLPAALVACMAAVAGAALPFDVGEPVTLPATAPASRPDYRRQEIDRVMEFFRITQPDVYEQAKTLRVQDPARFDRLIMAAAHTVNRLEAIRRRNPHLFDLSMQDLTLAYQSFRVAHELKRSDLPDTDRGQLRDRLRQIVSDEFDVQQQVRQVEIDEQQCRLADLRQQSRQAEIQEQQRKLEDLNNQIRERQDNKDKVIDKRVDDLIQRAPRLDW